MDKRDPATWLASHPRFRWRDGMLDRFGARLILDRWKHPAVEAPEPGRALNLTDPGTAGVLLALLDEEDALSDIVRDSQGWIVAIRDTNGEVHGFFADTLGEAAAWALLAWWGEDIGVVEVSVA